VAAKALFATQEGAALLLDPGRGDGGTLFVAQASVPQAPDTPREQRLSPWSEGADKKMAPQVAVASEHYNRLVRLVQSGQKVKMQVDLAVESKVWDKGMAFNTIAEIPGADKKDEIVMCGAHIDSWQASTGATDNGAGVAVCMEAVRILKALGVKPRRTIRVALWSGEEQGLYGSRAYVAEHFGTRDGNKLTVKPEYEKLSAYFNLDNGTGKVRGVWGQGNEAILPVFAEWLKPFHDLGATTLTLRGTGGTDHLPFDGINLPGFQFIQDRIEYDTRTHHSNQDSYDRIQAADMKQASILMAAFLYQAAMRDEKLPRKPLPANVTIVPDTGKSSSVASKD
jgi:Predicted aminopeptidases